MAFAWDVFDACDKELLLEATKHPKGFRFLKYRWKTTPKLLREQFNCNLILFFLLTTIVITFETEWFGGK